MAVAVYADVVSTLSGALTKINKKSPHAVDQKMVLATHRNAPTTQVGKCNRMYLRGLNSVTRSTPVSGEHASERPDETGGRPRGVQCPEEHQKWQNHHAELHLVVGVCRVRPSQRLIHAGRLYFRKRKTRASPF